MDLIQLARLDDLAGVKTLIQQGADVNAVDCNNQTALYFASNCGSSNVVEYLLDSGASISLGANPLIAAVRNDQYECCELLLQHHANVNFTNTEGESPMSVAVQKHHYSIILLLVKFGAIPSALPSDLAVYLLKHTTVEHTQAVQKLIDENVLDLASENIFLAAFRFAFKCGLVELADTMLSNGGYFKTDQLYPDAVYYSARNNWPTILSKLVEKGVNLNALTDGQTPLYAACKEGHGTIVTLLLHNGADPNVKNSQYGSMTPLHIASSSGWCDLMMELIQHGANCEQLANGKSAIDVACENGHEAALELLLKNGANPDRETGNTYSMLSDYSGYQSHSIPPLCTAAKNNSEMMVKSLLKYGANINASTTKGDTALHLSTSYTVIEMLLNAKADVNATNNSGETALSILCQKQQSDASVIELLLKFGADANICSPLHAACKNNNIYIVKLLLAYGADVNLVKTSKRLVFVPQFWATHLQMEESIEPSPLCSACNNGNIAIINFLLSNGAHVAFADSNGNTALHYAVERLEERHERQENSEEYDAVVTLLLQSNASVNVVNNKGETPLYMACTKGLTGVINQLLDCRADVGLTTSIFKKYPLLIVCERKFRDVAVMLLDCGTNVNMSNDDHETPLKIASANGDVELVKQLLRYGADVNQMQNISDTALHAAIVQYKGVERKGFTGVVQRLLKNRAEPNALNHKRETPLYLACNPTTEDVNLDIVQALLKHGADSNSCPPSGKLLSWQRNYGVDNVLPPLLAASRCGNTALVRLLMKYGATVDHRTEIGRTALHCAIGYDNDSFTQHMQSSKSNTSIVEILLSAGADPNAVDKMNVFPLYLACKAGNTDIAKLLLTHGASPNMKANDKYPLHAACRGWHYDLVKLLLQYNVDVALNDEKGKTALHCVLEAESNDSSVNEDRGIQDLVQLLLDSGADVNVVSKDGETPFHMACSRGLTPVVAKMLEYGAKVDGIGVKKLPLTVACRNKHMSVVQLLLSSGANPAILQEDRPYRRALPLHIAAEDGSSELVGLLLKHSSNVDITDSSGSTALHYGVECYHKVPTAMTSQCSDEVTATNSTKSVVDILMENKADVNILNNSGETPLYKAVSRGLLDVVSKMLQLYGGNPNKCARDRNALVAACQKRDVKLVDVLLKNGADPNPVSASLFPFSKDTLPLSTAVMHYSGDEIIMLLIQAGAIVNAIDSDGKSILCVAAENLTNLYYCPSLPKKLSAIRILLEHEADLNVLVPDGRSLLYLVVSAIARSPRCKYETHFAELLQLMLKHGAILSDTFNVPQRDVTLQSLKIMKNLATFDGKHEFIVDLFRAGTGFQLLAFCCHSLITNSGKARSICLCQAAILAGYMPSAEEQQDLQLAAAIEDEDGDVLGQLVNWLNEDRQRVPSLLRKCRVVIRRQLSVVVQHRSILPAIDKLPLPNIMKMYLQFDGTLTEIDLNVNSTDDRDQTRTPTKYNDYLSDSDDFLYDRQDSSDNDWWRYDDDNDDDFTWLM